MSETPLLDYIGQVEARSRADAGMSRAARRAEKVEPGWKAGALEAVRAYALSHELFLAEHVRLHVPHDADRRAVGAVLQSAQRRGWIKRDGYAPACSSNGSPKVRWRSLIYGGAA